MNNAMKPTRTITVTTAKTDSHKKDAMNLFPFVMSLPKLVKTRVEQIENNFYITTFDGVGMMYDRLLNTIDPDNE